MSDTLFEFEQPAVSIAETWKSFEGYEDRYFAIQLLINCYGEQEATEFLEAQTELAT